MIVGIMREYFLKEGNLSAINVGDLGVEVFI